MACILLCGHHDINAATYPAQRETYATPDADDIDIAIKNGYIYITTRQPLTLRIYSILGQLISQHNITVGTTRIKAPTRGVYIMQAGTVTRRLTIN